MAHYDLIAAEAQMRADAKAARDVGEAMIEAGGDRSFLEAQRGFDEARIQFTLSGMRLENQGMGRNETLCANAAAIGLVWASLLMGCVGNRERQMVNMWVQKSITETLADKEPDGFHVKSTFAAEEGGNG